MEVLNDCNIQNKLKRIRQAGERGNEMIVSWRRDGASEYLGGRVNRTCWIIRCLG